MVLEDHPSLWTDGSWEDYPVGGFEVAGAGVFLPAPEEAMRGAVWGTTEEYGDARLERCRVFMPVPSPLQTVQHAELWGAILAVQAFWPGHLGIDDLNVVRSIGRLLDQGVVTKPLPLFDDGDLISLIQNMIRQPKPRNCSRIWMRGGVFLTAWEFWYPMVLQLHRFMVAVVLVSVNHVKEALLLILC